VLHAGVGDVIEIDADSARPRRLRIVAALADSVLQGELLISEDAFRSIFPEVPGYRLLLAEVSPATPERIDAVSRTLEERLEPYGVDAQETTRRIEAYHRVENTYLSTFQALGGLGLVLGMVGLGAVIARNVLERRRELALLGAVGFTGRDLRTVVAAEQLSLLAAGVVIGLAAALIAVAPVKIARGGGFPALSFVWIAAVVIAGVVSTFWATRQVRRLPIIASLRSE
jgi:ABC-type antimicrobial peptide transport system permease subunit